MNSKVKDWIPPYVMTDFEDHNKQKNLVMVVQGSHITTQQILAFQLVAHRMS